VKGLLAMLTAVCVVSTMAPAFSAVIADEDRDQKARGDTLYRLHCASCHGKTGRGDGPVADVLRIPPPDLTRLAADHDGEFPHDEVFAAIDGRNKIVGHGSRDMPVWGWSFQERDRDLASKGVVEQRIRDIIAFIESIQRRPGEEDSSSE
jgi:mono/diheme cytochrome c family protein